MSIKIKLTGKIGGETTIDKDDYDRVIQHNWYKSQDYIVSKINKNQIRLSHFILNTEKGQQIDHINGNINDNRKCNLRKTNSLHNANNRQVSPNKKGTKFSYVFYKKQTGNFFGKIVYNKQTFSLGTFKTDFEAADAADMFIVHKLDNAKKLNFPENLDEYKNRKYNKIEKEKTTKYIGVCNINGYYISYIQYNKKRKHLLCCNDPIKCAKVYDQYIIDNNIPNKKLNFPQDHPDYNTNSIIKTLCENYDNNTVKLLIESPGNCLIDKNDYDKIKYYNCRYVKKKNRRIGYIIIDVNGETLRLHRFLMNEKDPNIYIDHINKNPLNNKKNNLRKSNHLLNPQNTSKRDNCSSKAVGISYNTKRRKWNCSLKLNGNNILNQYCDDEIIAICTRDFFILTELPDQHFPTHFTWTIEDICNWDASIYMKNHYVKLTNKKSNIIYLKHDFDAKNQQAKTDKNTSKAPGVDFNNRSNKWRCRIRLDNKILLDKLFKDEILAICTRDHYIFTELKGKYFKPYFEWTIDDLINWECGEYIRINYIKLTNCN